MNAGTVGLVAGLAGFFLGGFAVYVATNAQRDVADVRDVTIQDQESMEALAEQYRGLQESVQNTRKSIGDVRADEQQLRGVVGDLVQRVEAAEERLRSLRAGAVQTTDPQSANVGAPDEDVAKKRFEALREKVFRGDATPEEEAEFWELARTTGVVDDLIAQFKRDFEQNPRDIEAAFRLASAYTAKLLTVPDGPERGAWAAKGEEVYRAVLEEHPDSWEARFSLAFSLSQWPPFFANKGQEAIEQFERLRSMQSGLTPEARHTRTYLQLAELYRSKGNLEKAREVLADGAERHPDSESIRSALAHLDGM